jgi:multidrug efflux pump subunit AcrA (membrane-fusion protein)
MWLMLLVISLVAGADSGALPSDVKQYLYDNGLECCVAQIMSKPSWWSAGTGLDSLSDLRFLGDREIDRLPIPEVKRTILRTLAGEAREERRVERAQYMRSSERVATLLASLETLSRGFMLGFGISFIYETLLLNRDFYKAEEDLTPRVKRATLRAAVLGCATAVTMHGFAIFLPHSLRHNWLK